MLNLTPENVFVFRITHIENVPWILANGLHCCNSKCRDPNFVTIGRPGIIDGRTRREVPVAPGGTLSDYIPFYFTPYSMMLYNIKTGWDGLKKYPMSDIAILFSSLHKIIEEGLQFLFTDRHAILERADFSRDLDDLKNIDWSIIQQRDFRRDPENYPDKCVRYQAEALIHHRAPVTALLGITCHGSVQEKRLQAEADRLKLSTKIAAKPDWYH